MSAWENRFYPSLKWKNLKIINQFAYYDEFALKVEGLKKINKGYVDFPENQGAVIAAYGAAAKGSTLINYMDIGRDLIDFVVDRNVHKQGRYMPGQHIPIFDPGRLVEKMPDYVLMLAWNFEEEILQQQELYRKRGKVYHSDT